MICHCDYGPQLSRRRWDNSCCKHYDLIRMCFAHLPYNLVLTFVQFVQVPQAVCMVTKLLSYFVLKITCMLLIAKHQYWFVCDRIQFLMSFFVKFVQFAGPNLDEGLSQIQYQNRAIEIRSYDSTWTRRIKEIECESFSSKDFLA